jgi:hypothetical protein
MLKDRILMMPDDGLGIGGAEEPEVAAPAEESEGAEVQEPAEPVVDDGKTSADSAFAEMRRQNEEYQRRIEELEIANEEYDEALGYFFEGDDKALQAQAIAEERSLEDVRAERESQDEFERLRNENETLQERIEKIEIEQMMAEDLRKIQEIDPSVKSLDELGEEFFREISNGADAELVFLGLQAKRERESAKTPEPVGKVNEGGEESYFTREDVMSMSPEEVHKNYDAIRKSQMKW